MNWERLSQTLVEQGTHIGFQVLGALGLWIVGRWLIRLAVRLLNGAMQRQKMDSTVASYVASTINGLLNIVLIISILGAFGVQTATFAALFAAFGLAIGTAWSGLLANFAAGVFMIILRPFKVGDFVSAGGVTGTIVEIGPFATKINTPDNLLTIVGNNKILSDNVQNFSHNPFRRVDLTKQFYHDTDIMAVRALLKERLAQIPNVVKEPAPDVEILEFNSYGPLLAVRPYCSNEHYWQVYFDTTRMLAETSAEKGFTVPAQHILVRNG